MNNYKESILRNYRNSLNASRTTEYRAYIAYILGDVLAYQYESMMSNLKDEAQESASRCESTLIAVLNSDIMGISHLKESCKTSIREFYILVGGNEHDFDKIDIDVQE